MVVQCRCTQNTCEATVTTHVCSVSAESDCVGVVRAAPTHQLIAKSAACLDCCCPVSRVQVCNLKQHKRVHMIFAMLLHGKFPLGSSIIQEARLAYGYKECRRSHAPSPSRRPQPQLSQIDPLAFCLNRCLSSDGTCA